MLDRQGSGVGSRLASAGGTAVKALALVGTAAVGAGAIIGVAAVKAATDFQQSMELIRTQAGASQAEVNSMSQAVQQLAPAVGTGPDQLAAGLYHIESAGIRGAKALDILKVAAEGAKVGNADLESVTQAMIAANVSGIGGIKNMTQAMGVLNGIVGSGDMRMQDLATAMSTGILSTAKVFGLNITDVGAAMATMTDNAIPAQDAATRLRMTFSLMGAPSAAAIKAFKSIGLGATQLGQDMRSKGLIGALEDLQAHLRASGETATQQAATLSKAFGGGRTSSAILLLLTQLDRMKSKYGDIAKASTSFGDAWAATQQNVAFQWQRLNSYVQTGLIVIGDRLLPIVNSVISGLNTWIGANQGLLASIGEVLSGAIPLSQLVGNLANMLPGIVTALAGWAHAFLAWIAPMVPVLLDMLNAMVLRLLSWIADEVPYFQEQLQYWIAAFVAWVQPIIPQVVSALGAVTTAIGNWVLGMVPIIAGDMANLALQAVGALASGIVGNPGAVVAALGALLAGAAIITVIAAAGAVAGAAYAAAMAAAARVSSAITQFASGIIAEIQVQVIALAGTIAGEAWAAAYNLAATLGSPIVNFARDIVARIAEQVGIVVAEGTAEGLAFGEAFDASATSSGAIGGVGTAIAGSVATQGGVIAAAGTAAAAAFSTAFVAGAATYIGGRLNDLWNSLGAHLGIPMPAAGSGLPGAGMGIPSASAANASSAAAAAAARRARLLGANAYTHQGVGATGVTDTQDVSPARRALLAAQTATAQAHKRVADTATAALHTLVNQYTQLATGKAAKGGSSAIPAMNTTASVAQAQQDALAKAQQQLAIAQLKAAGGNTKLLSAADAVTNAQNSVKLSADKLREAQDHLKAVEEAHFKTSAARTKAIDAADRAVHNAQNALTVANVRLATARQNETNAEQAAAAAAAKAATKGTTVRSQKTVGAVGVGPSVGVQTFIIDNRIFLDSIQMKNWISEVIAQEIRSIAGPALAGSAQ